MYIHCHRWPHSVRMDISGHPRPVLLFQVHFIVCSQFFMSIVFMASPRLLSFLWLSHEFPLNIFFHFFDFTVPFLLKLRYALEFGLSIWRNEPTNEWTDGRRGPRRRWKKLFSQNKRKKRLVFPFKLLFQKNTWKKEPRKTYPLFQRVTVFEGFENAPKVRISKSL